MGPTLSEASLATKGISEEYLPTSEVYHLILQLATQLGKGALASIGYVCVDSRPSSGR